MRAKLTISLGYLDLYDPIPGAWIHKEIRLVAATVPQILANGSQMCGGFLPGEAFTDGASGIIREVWIFGECFQLTFHVRRNRHLTASAERLSGPNPITIVVIREMFNVGYSAGLNITVF